MPRFLFAFILLPVLFLSSCHRKFNRLLKEADSYKLTTEVDLVNTNRANEIDSFYDNGLEGSFMGQDSVSIYYRIFNHPNTERAILISSGRSEAAIKYKEIIYDLFHNGYSIYIHDHRGQGLSGRMTEDPDMGYVDSFQFYVDDMKYFYNTFIKPKNHKKRYLLAHSMGGAIGMTYLEQNAHDFNAAAFSSPMLGLKPPICSLVKILEGDEPKYAIGESEYNDAKSDFDGNTLTGSKLRFDRMIDAFDETPKAQLGGATYKWLHESCAQFEYMFDNIDKIETPFILFSAENEQIVYPQSHQKFVSTAQKLGKDCKAFEVSDAQHELFIEKDVQRIETLTETLNYFKLY